jgi:hypothetical protein
MTMKLVSVWWGRERGWGWVDGGGGASSALVFLRLKPRPPTTMRTTDAAERGDGSCRRARARVGGSDYATAS